MNNREQNVNPKIQNDLFLIESFIRDAQKATALLEELQQKADWFKNENDLRKFTVVTHGIKTH